MKSRKSLVALVGSSAMTLVLFLNLSVAAAATKVLLGTAESFAVLAGAGVTNTGPTVVNGDLGTCPTLAITGFPPGTVNGTQHSGDAVCVQAQEDALAAYNNAAGQPATTTFGGPTDLGGMTLVSGVYKSPSSFGITGTLILDGQNNPDSVFIFQAGSTLTTAVDSEVVLINGAQACNVFWQVGSSATIGVRSDFSGTVLALTDITANTGAVITGRLLALNGAVTLDSNLITRSTCAPPPTTTTTLPGGTTTTTLPGGTTTTTSIPPPTTTSPFQFVPVLVNPSSSGGGGNGGVAIISNQNSSSSNSQSSASSGGQVSQAAPGPAQAIQAAAPAARATPTPQLARTGSDVPMVAALGGLLFIIGAALRADPKRKT